VESKVGAGSKFSVRLPVRQTAAAGQISSAGLADVPVPLQAGETPADTLAADLDQPLLLVIEDNADVVTYIRSILEDQYQILVARNGAEGIEKAFETIPDIVLSDLMMPEKDGFEVTQTLKNDERTSHIPIVLLTAKADVESRIAGLERGADAYLAKPFEKKELIVRLEKLVELRRKLQETFRNRSFPSVNWEIDKTEKSPVIPLPSSLTSDIEDAFLIKIGQIMEQHLDDAGFAVAEFCQAAGFSQPQLYRKIKALTGQSIVAWMRSFRLRKAKDMLEHTQMNISEIAYQVGFSDPAYFSRAFSEEFDVPPTSFRK
jgi:YesN/AraC family two-component response regulator